MELLVVKNVIRILSVICLLAVIPASLVSADTDTILPDGDGAVNNWTASSGTDRYSRVNDGSTSTYIYNTNEMVAFTTFIFARIGSTNYELASFAQSTSWSTVYRNSTENPATSAAWTWDDVNNAQFGVAIATGATERSYQYFTFDATSGTGDIDYLRFKTTHMRYYTGVYYQARVAVFELEVNYTIPIEEPEIESKAASNIAATSARLNARVIDDGGEACEVRFGYGETTQTAVNFESYDTVTDWFGAYETGQSPYYDVSGLTQTTTYYFRVQIKNSAGTYTSGELDFTTDSSVGTPSNFNGAPSATSIYLSWTKGTGATNTVIRYSYSAYPTAITEGIALYSGSSTGYQHTGLTPGKNYYYSMWGESGGVYSASYVTLLVTTDASTGGDGAIDQPEQPGGWFQIPDDSALVNFEPFYSIVNDAADSWDMPRGTLWVILGLFLSALASVSVFMIGKEILWAGIAGAGMIALITAIGILQLWMASIIIIIIGMFMMRRA